MSGAKKLPENYDNSHTLGVKSEMAGVDAEISGVAWVLDDVLSDMAVEKDIRDTSEEENRKISYSEESHNKINP